LVGGGGGREEGRWGEKVEWRGEGGKRRDVGGKEEEEK